MPDHSCATQLANDFQQYFNSKVQNIRKTFPEDSTRAMQFDGSENVTKFTSFHNFKFCELDSLPTPLLKQCTDELLPVIKHIVNDSLRQAYVPRKCITAIVKPLLKKPSLD